MRARVSGFLGTLAAVGLLVAAWWGTTSSGLLDPFFFGDPGRVAQIIGGWAGDGTLLRDTTATVLVLVLGCSAGTVTGVAIGAAMALRPTLRAVFEPYFAFFNAVPRLVFYPMFAIVLGFGLSAKVIYVAFVVVFLVAANTVAGLASLDDGLADHVRMLGADGRQLAVHLYAPSLLVWLLATSRTSVGLALQGVIVAELIGTAAGLGHLAAVGQSLFDIDVVWASIVVMVVVAVALDAVLAFIERRTEHWQAV